MGGELEFGEDGDDKHGEIEEGKSTEDEEEAVEMEHEEGGGHIHTHPYSKRSGWRF